MTTSSWYWGEDTKICYACGHEVMSFDNGEVCTGCGANEVEELGDWAYETCEHGLSAWLCAGPNHYSDDF